MAGERPSQRYQLGGRIGGGGMAEVFEATLVGAEGFLRPVAVKRIQPTFSSDATFGRMFVNEARIASLLHHPNIAAVLDFDRDEEGRYFLVMELIRGLDFLRRLLDTGQLPIPIAVHIAAEMLRGLDYAHELEHEGRRLGIVHRDISPHNVMVSWDGSVKLVDFGIAKAMAATGISRSGTVKGKVAYMSPEQANGLELDGRTDVFAVGVVLHEILVGDRLFRGATEPEILARLLTQPIPRPHELAPLTPADLDRVVMTMLERDRDARYPTAHAALEALLGTSATSPRAGLELEQLLSERFPGQAPRRRSTGAPVETPQRLQVAPVSPVGATMPAGPAGMAARSAPLHAARTPDAAVDTPTVAGERVSPPATVPARARRPWRAGVMVVLAAAFVTGGVLVARQRARRGSETTVAANTGSGPVAAQADAGQAGARDAGTAAVEPAPPAPDPPAALAFSPAADAGVRRGAPPARSRESRRSRPGVLDVKVDPWADITVDGVHYGQSPQKIPLSPGPHRVLLRNTELGKSETLNVKIRSRETKLVDRHWP